MKKIFLSMMGLVLLSGCSATTAGPEVRTKEELKYKKILVMPFTKGEGADASLAQGTFINELSLFPDIEIVGNGQMDETTIKNLGVTHPDTFGPVDFSVTPQGDERRQKVLESFKADVLVFGYIYMEQGLASLHIQMLEGQSGDMILNFFKESSIPEGMAAETTRDIARKAVPKVIDFLKENVVITKFHRR